MLVWWPLQGIRLRLLLLFVLPLLKACHPLDSEIAGPSLHLIPVPLVSLVPPLVQLVLLQDLHQQELVVLLCLKVHPRPIAKQSGRQPGLSFEKLCRSSARMSQPFCSELRLAVVLRYLHHAQS